MNAGQALGLLAGLGAINALRGGRDGAGPRFTGLLDMIDGGGAGQSGDKFEGGGLVSMLGNLFAKPLEAQERVERIAADTNATKAVTEVLKQAVTPEQRSSAAMTEMNRQRGLLADQFDTRDQQGATSFRNSMSGYPDMSMPVIEGYTTPAIAPELRQPAGTPTAPYEQTGAVTDIRFGPRGEPTSLLDTREQAPSPDEQRVMQAIVDGNMMPNFMDMEPRLQRAYVNRLIELGY